MFLSDPVETLSEVLHLARSRDLPLKEDGRPHDTADVEVHAMFPQEWSNTSCGFGGIAGQAFTSAYTTLIVSTVYNMACVYIGRRFAYRYMLTNKTNFDETFECIRYGQFPGQTDAAKSFDLEIPDELKRK